MLVCLDQFQGLLLNQVFRGYKECCLRYKINGKIGIHFCFGSCGFKKEQGYSLRDMKYLIDKDGEIKLHKACQENKQSK